MAFKDKAKHYLREFWLFISSGIFIKNCLGILGFFALMLFITIYWTQCYTRHNNTQQVRDFRNITFDEAKRLARTDGLRLVIIDSTRYDEKLSPGVITDQDPIPQSRVKTNRTIYLSINKPTPPNVLVDEDLYGKPINEVKRLLSRKRLKYKIVAREFDANTTEEVVLKVMFEGDTIVSGRRNKKISVPEGAVIELITSETEGGGEVAIPNLVCKTYSEAQFEITANDLSVGTVIFIGEISDTATAYIFKQKPQFIEGTTIKVGEQVDLFIQQSLPGTCGGASEPTDFDDDDDDEGGFNGF